MRICEVNDMNPVKDNFGVRGTMMRKNGTIYMTLVLLMLIVAVLPGVAGAGTAGKVFNFSLDIGTLDNKPLYSITSFPTTFKVRAKVMDQLGSPITGLTSTQLVIQSGRNVTTGVVWAQGSQYAVGDFTELGNGLYDWTATLNPGALTTNDIGQFQVRVTGAPATDNQWLANTIFVKNGSYNDSDFKYVEVQPGINNNGDGRGEYGDFICSSEGFYDFKVRFFSPSGVGISVGEVKNIYTPTGELVPGLVNWTESSGGVPYGYSDFTLSGYRMTGSVDYALFIHASPIFNLRDQERQYITVSIKKGTNEFQVPIGLTAVMTAPWINQGSPLPVPTYSNPALFPTTYVADYHGWNPVTVPPGGAATAANQFSVRTNTGADTMQGVSIDLSSGSAAAVSRIDIVDAYGGAAATVYGTLANPATDTPFVPLTTPLGVGAGGVHYFLVRVTPKSHADMPLPPGASLAVRANVTAISHTEPNPVIIASDNLNTTLIIDNLSPANPSWNMITPGNGQASLSWTNPGDADYSQAVILRNTAPVADTPAEGGMYLAGSLIGTSTVACVVNKPGTSCIDSGLTNGAGYYYRLFAKDTSGNYSVGGSGSGPHVLGNQTTPATCAAVSVGPTALRVTMPYTNDTNGNNRYTVEYRLSADSGWTTWVTAASHANSPYATTITGLLQGARYDVRCTFLDTDAVEGQSTQIIAGIVMLDDRTTAGTGTAVAASTTSIAVTMPYTDDFNGNNACAVDYQLAGAAGWTNWITAAPHVASPCAITVADLEQGGTYNVRMTYLDSDGVNGVNPQTIMSVILPDNRTEAGTVSASGACGISIRVVAPFAKDANGNGTITVEYKKSSDDIWSVADNGVPRSSSPSVTTVSGLTPQTNYDFRVTYQDPDGVVGTAVQPLYGISSATNRLTHSSLTANKNGYWAEYGGWGVPGGQYGEFTCLTCHTKRTTNASGIKTIITLNPLPGSGSDNTGGAVLFNGPTGLNSFGDDGVDRSDPVTSNRICEVCHTLTTGPSPNLYPVHRKIQTVSNTNHGASNNKDCTSCHRHDDGFKRSVQQSVPSAPFMSFPTNVTSSSVTWNFSSPGPNPTGYKLHNSDNTFEIKTATGAVKHIDETGMAANTLYTRHVHAYNAAGDSPPSGDYSVHTLSAPPNVSANKATSTWYNTVDFIFTNVAGFGTGGVQYYRYAWDQNTTHAFLGSETQWSTGTLPLYATANGAWYLHVKSYNVYDIGNGTLDYGPYYYDSTNISTPTLSIGSPSATAFKGDPVTYPVTYSNANTVTLTAGNVTLNSTGNATGTIAVSGSGATSRTVTISNISGGGTLGISIEAGTASNDTGNVAAAAGPSATFAVDGTLPSAFANAAPANNATGLLYDTVQVSGTATDNGNGPVEYFFEVATDIEFTKGVIQSGWQTSASFVPPGLPAGTTCYWHFKARNTLLNETTYTTPWSFTTADIFTSVNLMTKKRAYHTITPLNNGKVLIAGGHDGILNSAFNSAELYDPSTNTFTPIANPMINARYSHTATKLDNGKVLLVGGRDSANPLGSAELYDPVANAFTATGNNMTAVRYFHTATLLANGKVLITGGKGSGTNYSSAELYDPDLNTFTSTGSMHTLRFGQAATLLPDGKVIITGGRDTATAAFTSAELYDPSAGTFAYTTGSMNAGRNFHTTTLLSNGKILITGGSNNNNYSGCIASAEVFDPGTNTFSYTTTPMNSTRYHHIATLLSGGKVLITGGSSTSAYLGSAEIYDPNTDTFTSTPYNMNSARYYHGAALLSSGKVLITGGMTNATTYTDSAEVYGSNP
jgi:Kelch motif/Galactose oxidase, central domain